MPADLSGPIFCLIAYLVGSIPFGILVSRVCGTQDPRQAGSQNIGATNVLRLSGKKVGLLTLIGDLGKGWLVAWAAVSFFGQTIWAFIAVLCVVLGHMFPVFLNFRGGKGVATGLGGILGLYFVLGMTIVIVWLAAVGIGRHSSGGALAAFVSLPIVSWLMMPRADFVIFTLILSSLVIIKHRENIRRLLNGTETRI